MTPDSKQAKEYMPMHPSDRREFKDCPEKIPMSMLNEEQAQDTHSQSLSRLAQRGGISALEAIGIMDHKWPLDMGITSKQAVAELNKRLAALTSEPEIPEYLQKYLDEKIRPYHNRLSYRAGAIDTYAKLLADKPRGLRWPKVSEKEPPEGVDVCLKLYWPDKENPLLCVGILKVNKEYNYKYIECRGGSYELYGNLNWQDYFVWLDESADQGEIESIRSQLAQEKKNFDRVVGENIRLEAQLTAAREKILNRIAYLKSKEVEAISELDILKSGSMQRAAKWEFIREVNNRRRELEEISLYPSQK